MSEFHFSKFQYIDGSGCGNNLSEIKINTIGLSHFMVNVLNAQYLLCLEKICVHLCKYICMYLYLHLYFIVCICTYILVCKFLVFLP